MKRTGKTGNGFRRFMTVFLVLILAAGAGWAAETDLDEDGLPDWWEERFVGAGGLSLTRDDADDDPDGDGLSNLQEFENGCHPLAPDTDGDGLGDGEEVGRFGTSPVMADTDGGGWDDGTEVAARLAPLNPDDDGNDAAATFTVSLERGWNLISLPVQPPNTDIGTLLSSIAGRYDIVWGFENGDWKSFDPARPQFSTLTALLPGRGYWIEMNRAATLSVPGPPVAGDVPLSAGWNLVGFNFMGGVRAPSALEALSDRVAALWTYSAGVWRVFDPQNPGFSDLQWLEAGYGYWIKSTRAATWRIP
jgi:hypothetical protein